MKPIYFVRIEPKNGKFYWLLRYIFYNGKIVFEVPIERVTRGNKLTTTMIPVSLMTAVKRCRIARFTRIRDAIVFKMYRVHGKTKNME